ncbi:MAG: DNA polymerase III subunit gamma/tau [Clostridia bacterium]|nr:DNA polymerase III subunit gamma/tau [Clostridia bacterium]
MAYLALYRMFRPTTLGDVVRQEHIVTVLKNQIDTGRIGHAYLFCGPRGTGKTSIAKIFAAAINCETPMDGSPCGKCAACRALKDPSNLDITEIDAASNNGVDEMRDLREKVQYPPVAGRYKVYIIDEVHMLSPGAFNALLKTLEEPPAHAVFILATTESQKIPATILSRCMRFDFKLIPQKDLETRLRYVFDQIGKTYDDEAIAAIARAGAGSVRDMLSIADTCASYTTGKLTYADVNTVLGNADFQQVATLCRAILASDAGGAFEGAENFLSAGKSVGMLLKDVMNFLNACAVAKTCRDGKNILAFPDDMYAEVAAVAKNTDGHRLLRVTEIFADVEMDLKYSTSPRILFETAVLKASMPSADYDIEALLGRIAELEKKIGNGVFVKNEGGMSATNEKMPVTTARKGQEENLQRESNFAAEKTPEYALDEEYIDVPPEMDAPPDEAEMGGSVYFDPSFVPRKPVAPSPITRKQEMHSSTHTQTTATASEVAPRAVKPAQKGDAKATFGSFLRSIRKIARSGVLLTLCMDLDSEYEEDGFILYTSSDTIYRSLTKPDHAALIEQAFAVIGIDASGYAVRLRGKQSDNFNKSLNELKETFGGVNIDVK